MCITVEKSPHTRVNLSVIKDLRICLFFVQIGIRHLRQQASLPRHECENGRAGVRSKCAAEILYALDNEKAAVSFETAALEWVVR